jgi:hypothetical protein
MRLLDHFKDHFFIVYLDIAHNLDRDDFTQVDLLYLIGGAVYRVAEEAALDPNPQGIQALSTAVSTLVRRKRETLKDESLDLVELVKGIICFGAQALGSELGGRLAKALLQPASISTGVSEEIAYTQETKPDVQRVIDSVNRIIADVETKSSDGPLLLVVDGLDKIENMTLADRLFVHSRALLGPLCSALYTAPMSLYRSFPRLAQEFSGSMRHVANVRLLPKDASMPESDQALADNLGLMQEVVRRRLAQVSGTEGLIEDVDLRSLILKSGGVVRWLVRLFHDACGAAQIADANRITPEAVQEAMRQNAQGFLAGRTVEAREELRRVRREKRPSESELSRRLVQEQFVLAYDGGDLWYDVHPLIWDALGDGMD